jgi:phage terminase small subunit
MAAHDLNFRQRLFVSAYLGKAMGNATEAARIAGYRHPMEYSHQLLQKTTVREAIARKAEEVTLSANEILSRLADQASADMSDFLTIGEDGVKVDLEKARRLGRLHQIKKFSRNKFGIVLELHDSQSALALLGKYHGLFDRIELGDESDEALTARSPMAD